MTLETYLKKCVTEQRYTTTSLCLAIVDPTRSTIDWTINDQWRVWKVLIEHGFKRHLQVVNGLRQWHWIPPRPRVKTHRHVGSKKRRLTRLWLKPDGWRNVKHKVTP